MALAFTVVLQSAGDRGAHLAQDRRVTRERLIEALHHQHALLPREHRHDQVRWEGTEHGQVEHGHRKVAFGAKVGGHGLGVAHHRALTEDHPFRPLEVMGAGPRIVPARERLKLAESLVRQLRDMVEVERALRGHTLREAVPVLKRTQTDRIVEVEHLRDAAARFAEHQPLGFGRAGDAVGGVAKILADQFAFRKKQRLDAAAGEISVLGQKARGEGQLGDAMGHQIEIGRLLDVASEDLKEAGIVDRVVVVMTGLHAARLPGQGPSGDVEDVGKSPAGGDMERLVHLDEARTAGEVGGPQAGKAQARGHRRRSGSAFGFEEQELAAVDVRPAL